MLHCHEPSEIIAEPPGDYDTIAAIVGRDVFQMQFHCNGGTVANRPVSHRQMTKKPRRIKIAPARRQENGRYRTAAANFNLCLNCVSSPSCLCFVLIRPISSRHQRPLPSIVSWSSPGATQSTFHTSGSEYGQGLYMAFSSDNPTENLKCT